MKITLLLTFGVCFTSLSMAPCAERVVYFDCGDLLSGPPLKPALTLQNLLAKHPRQNQFRVNWGAFGSLGGSSATLFYDRHHQLLRLQQKTDYLVDDEKPTRRSSLERWTIFGVSKSRMQRLIHFYADKPNEKGNDISFLAHLDHFGCRVRRTANFSRTYVVPQPRH